MMRLGQRPVHDMAVVAVLRLLSTATLLQHPISKSRFQCISNTELFGDSWHAGICSSLHYGVYAAL